MTLQQKRLKEVLKDAKECPVKGRLYIYEKYKQQLLDLDLSSEEYTQACRKLANNLGV